MSFKPLLLTCCVLIGGAVAAAQEEPLTPLMKSAVATVLTQIPGDQCTAPQPKPFPGEMKFYHTFHPTDSYYEAWCKIQMFKTSGQTDVTLDLATDEHRQRLTTWRDTKGLDGQPTGTNQWFATEWVRQLSRFANSLDVAAFFWRATRQAKDFGVPADSEQGGYLFYNADLVLTMANLDIMGVKFMVQATLSPDLDLVRRRLAEGKPGYPEFEMFSPEDRRKMA